MLNPSQLFGLFRIIFGSYLLWHFACLLPYGHELFTTEGIITADINPFYGKWPNPLFLFPALVTPLLFLACLCALLFISGQLRKTSALLLWFILTCTFTANPLIANPSLAYVGLLLLLCTLAPSGEAFVFKKHDNPNWAMPPLIPLTAWILLATSYTFSGILKLGSPSWLDGSALQHLLNNPLARPGLMRDLLLALPDSFLQLATWGTLGLEIIFLPLIFFKKIRPWAWTAMVLMHLGIITTVDFTDLSLGMIMIHLFTIQPLWLKKYLPAKKSSGQKNHLVFIDGDCLFCQSSARTLIEIDQDAVLQFAPLQGTTAHEFLPDSWRVVTTPEGAASGAIALIEHPDTPQEMRYQGLDAILRALQLSGGPLSLLWIFHLLPTLIKSPFYNFIARHRHLLPSRKDACQIPTPEVKARFLP